jgi:hypothetical protein
MRLRHIRGTILAIIDTDNNTVIYSKKLSTPALCAGAADVSGPTANYSKRPGSEIVSVMEG